jgi:DHA1 family bicyclomycin/chloramphenicol resistance-like MFS transporter
MAPFTKGAGSASAVMGALQMGCGAIASALVGVFFNNTGVPMTAIMSACSISGLIILLIGQKKIRYNAKQVDAEAHSLELLEKY